MSTNSLHTTRLHPLVCARPVHVIYQCNHTTYRYMSGHKILNRSLKLQSVPLGRGFSVKRSLSHWSTALHSRLLEPPKQFYPKSDILSWKLFYYSNKGLFQKYVHFLSDKLLESYFNTVMTECSKNTFTSIQTNCLESYFNTVIRDCSKSRFTSIRTAFKAVRIGPQALCL